MMMNKPISDAPVALADGAAQLGATAYLAGTIAVQQDTAVDTQALVHAQSRSLAIANCETTQLLTVSGLCKSFAGHQVVKDVSFDIRAGEVFSLLGQNGAGKTTTIKMCVGLLSPDAGTVRINGLDPQKTRSAATSFGALLEGNRNIYWRMTPYENLRYFGVLKGLSIGDAADSAGKLLHRFNLIDKKNQQVHKLSRGMQQKLAIAVAMLNRPKVLFLDEPTLGLDVGSVAQMLEIIRELAAEGTAIVLTTHQLDIAEELSDRVAIIHQGRILKMASTSDLTREFSPSGYEIQLGGVLEAGLREQLAKSFGAQFEEDGRIYLPGEDGANLYGLLEALRPLPLESVAKSRTDLTRIFLQLTGEQVDA
jgi:ABC-2 type transport system ATP-binding protein